MRQHAGDVGTDRIATLRQIAERRARDLGQRRGDHTQIGEGRMLLRQRAQQNHATVAFGELLRDQLVLVGRLRTTEQ